MSQFKFNECPPDLLWLILKVSLTGLKDAPVAGKTLFLDVSMRMLLENTSIWNGGIKKNTFSNVGSHYPLCWGWIEQKAEGGPIETSMLSCLDHQQSWFLGLQTETMTYFTSPSIINPLFSDLHHWRPWCLGLDLDWIITPGFLVLHRAYGNSQPS